MKNTENTTKRSTRRFSRYGERPACDLLGVSTGVPLAVPVAIGVLVAIEVRVATGVRLAIGVTDAVPLCIGDGVGA